MTEPIDVHAAADEAFIRSLPKVELHCHLEGAVPAGTFIELADRHGLELPTRDPAHVYDFDSFLVFLDRLYLVCSSMRTAQDFADATYASLAHAVASGNVVYREMFFNPTNHDTPYTVQVEGIVEGIRAAERDHGIRCRMIAGINRRHSPAVALELVEAMVAHPVDEVIGIGLDDDEDAGPPEWFAAAYALAGRHGLHRTAHAGELGSAANVATSLDVLGCERIDHGYGMVEDPALLRRVIDAGVHVTGAWFVNNFHYGVFTEGRDPATSPLARMVGTDLSVSLNTDDPTMIPTDLNAELLAVTTTLGLSRAQLLRRVLDAVDGAWVDDDERRVLRRRVEAAAAG
jgi:adenosine deaminase